MTQRDSSFRLRVPRCIGVIFGTILYRGLYWGYIGIMEKKMETTIVYWGYIGIMEKKMETTILYGAARNSDKVWGLSKAWLCKGHEGIAPMIP